MAKKLVNLLVNEISLVDKGANQHAHVSFFKSKGSNMTPKELEDKLAKAEKDVATLTTENADLKKKLDDATAEVKKSVTDVQKKLDDSEAEVKKLKEDGTKKDEEIAKLKTAGEDKDLLAEVAKKFPLTAGTAEEKAAVLKAVKAMPEAQSKVVLKQMEDAEKILADLAKEKGTSGATNEGGAKDAKAKLDELAKKIATDEKTTFEQGFSKALDTDEGRKLNEEIRAAKQ